ELGGFDTQYKIAADYDLISRIYLKYHTAINYYSKLITYFRLGGLSSDYKNLRLLNQEVGKIRTLYFNEKTIQEQQMPNEWYYKKWIEKKLFYNKGISNIIIKNNISKIALWGTGELAVIIHKELLNEQIEVIGYVDNNVQKQGLSLNNVPVYSP